ncbi:MAG: thioredoxin-disulfide reductase [Verrucomicrobiota bacterium]
MENVLIIGTGCAGWTSAIYTGRAGLKPIVITGSMPGGLLTTTSIVENFPGFPEGVDGTDLMMKLQQQAERFGAEIRYGTVDKVDFSKTPFTVFVDGEAIQAKSVIIATGSGHRHLGIESEKLLDKKGVTYCAVCDGALPMFRNQPLVVVGGGDSACEEATYLTRFSSSVYLVHRRDSLRASKVMAERTLANPKIKPIWDSAVEEILGVDQNKVTGVKLKNLKSGAVTSLDCAGVFVAIGHIPNTTPFQGQIELEPNGYIKLFGGGQTSVKGVFAAGDVADSVYRQAITAAGSGCAAALDCERYLAALE